MRIRFPVFILAFVVLTGLGFAQEALTNEAIVKMVDAGMSTELIFTMIRNTPGNNATRADTLVALREKGLTDDMLAAIVAANSRSETEVAKDESGAPSEASADVPEEVGIYYVEAKTGELKFMEPEIVTWKTGGFWKSVATVGLTKGHVNGVVKSRTSRYVFGGNEEMVIYCSEGTSGTEYQLLKLWGKKKRREFRAVTGGIIHASGGADENLVAFEPVRVRPRIYRFNLPDLPPGEYGLLPPGVADSSSAASLGKIYAFTVGE